MSETHSTVYYRDHYWNDYRFVASVLLQRMTKRPTSYWRHWFATYPNASSEEALITFFQEKFAHRKFENGLVLCCGDGRFDRLFFDLGIVKNIDAFDISEELVAKAESEKGKRNIHYFLADANTLQLPEKKYDLVVNVASLHHIQYLNAFLAQVYRSMKPDGVFFHFDYVGPHRNQLSFHHWAQIRHLNRSLGPYKKQVFHYPQVPLMLASDPSEAIHSDLVESYVDRYFESQVREPAGGALAYMLLHNNHALAQAAEPLQRAVLQRILRFDKRALDQAELPNFFMFQISTPRKNFIPLPAWQEEENIRENRAATRLGTYTWPSYLQTRLHRWRLERYLYKPYWYARLFIAELLLKLREISHYN